MKYRRLLKNRMLAFVVLLGLLCSRNGVDIAYATDIREGTSIEDESVYPEEYEKLRSTYSDSTQEAAEDGYVYIPSLPRYGEEMDEETAEWIDEAGELLVSLGNEREIMALVYMADTYPLRSQPASEAEEALTLFSGQTVTILDVAVDSEYQVWEYVRVGCGDTYYEGYIPREKLAVSDERFLQWEQEYGMNPSATTYAMDGEVDAAQDILEFPESYQPMLQALKEQHPNWTFVKLNTGMDWNDVIAKQLEGGKSLIYKTFPEWAKYGLYDGGNWYYATEAVLQIYMDPRNSLTEDTIFQFEQLTYNAQYHTLEAVQSFLNTTFMIGDKPAPGMRDLTYGELFYYIGGEAGREVSPFHLAARVLQEQGQGQSPLISGVEPGYEGFYNYFNIGASGKSNEEVILNGLEYAKSHNWNNAYMSIQGGADVISANYIKKGQDTLYLQKFNVNPNGYYKPHTHQYMQNITAPTSEGKSIKKLYDQAGALESPLVFKIPVYDNMPEKPCEEPKETLDIVLEIPNGYTDTKIWLDGVPFDGALQDKTIKIQAKDRAAKTAVMYQYNEKGVPVGMYLWTLTYDKDHYVVTPQPELQDLLTYHGFSVRITGKAGIRFKTGINIALRKKLIEEGVNGYKLTEYGTLIMTAANSEIYPMVKGGLKTLRGVNYGIDENGNFQNVVYEAVEDRYRYTSVLTGLPKEQYNTDFAFRGYAILEYEGQQYIVYGPKQAKSIYSISKQVLEMGTYAEGTEANIFLGTLVAQTEELVKAEEEAKRQAEEEARKQAEEEAKRQAEEEKKQAEELDPKEP